MAIRVEQGSLKFKAEKAALLRDLTTKKILLDERLDARIDKAIKRLAQLKTFKHRATNFTSARLCSSHPQSAGLLAVFMKSPSDCRNAKAPASMSTGSRVTANRTIASYGKANCPKPKTGSPDFQNPGTFWHSRMFNLPQTGRRITWQKQS